MGKNTGEKRGLVREPFSGISHFVGVLLSIAGLVALLILAHGRPWHSLGYAIFGVSLIVLYLASTLFHSLYVSERKLEALLRFDYSAIFLLIAGTYAPICLVPLRSGLGLPLLAVEYGLAVVGIVFSVVWHGKPHWLRMVLYLSMGWLAVIAIPPLFHILPPNAVSWLIAGGVLYSVGTYFVITNRPRLWPGKFAAHDLWHLFVLGGSACHFVFMLWTVAIP